MITYVTLGTNDFSAAEDFYNQLLVLLGATQSAKTERMIFWSQENGTPALLLVKPRDGNKATVGNGVMVALTAKNREQVDQVYAKAIELGASDEGEPGLRDSGYYCGYFRDLDGNKFNIIYPVPVDNQNGDTSQR